MKLLPIALLIPSGLASLGGHCPPTGPVLPPPHIPTHFNLSNLQTKLNYLQNVSFLLPWNITTTSFSVELTSQNGSFFEYHHTAPVRSHRGGVSRVDGNTVYRIMSVTKTFTVLALLLNVPEQLDTPIWQYVPELVGVKEYDDITLRMLAAQLSGVPRNGRVFDLYESESSTLLKAGFPKPNLKDIPSCDTVANGACNHTEFFTHLLQDGLDWLPGDKESYSNQAYTLLGFALQNITGQPLAELIKNNITVPLNLSSTGFDAPDLSKAIIPVGQGELFMGLDFGNFNATAGLYSTPNELTTFVRSILRSTLLPAARTRAWIKPGGFAGSYSAAVGAPWEIYRLSGLTPDNRVIDVYTKSGDLPGYAAYIVLLPDYDVGATILVSAENAHLASETILDIVTKALIPSIDRLAREQAKAKYGGHYAGAHNASTNATASLDLVVDRGPGLKIKRWVNNGKSILRALAATKQLREVELDARLYPIGQDNRWRLMLETIHPDRVDVSAPSMACKNWLAVDTLRWASRPVDEFRFEVTDGVVKGVVNPGLRATLIKEAKY